MNNDAANKIRLIRGLIFDVNALPSDPNLLSGNFYLKKLRVIYERTINFSMGVIDDSNKDKQNLEKYFSQYPFVEDYKWLIAKDNLISFLIIMLDKVQFEGSSQYIFWNFIHINIIEISKQKFEDGHYADSVESAMKAVNKRVKNTVRNKTSKENDGKSLMLEAFSPKNPIIILDDSSSESGKNVQEGYMHIFAGAMQGIRNPKAHDNLSITRERAIHQLFLASLLMYKLDEGKS